MQKCIVTLSWNKSTFLKSVQYCCSYCWQFGRQYETTSTINWNLCNILYNWIQYIQCFFLEKAMYSNCTPCSKRCWEISAILNNTKAIICTICKNKLVSSWSKCFAKYAEPRCPSRAWVPCSLCHRQRRRRTRQWLWLTESHSMQFKFIL